MTLEQQLEQAIARRDEFYVLLKDEVIRRELAEARNLELMGELERARQTMVAAAEEIGLFWDAHCNKEGYGPANLMRRLEAGLATSYPGYSAGRWEELQRELKETIERRDVFYADLKLAVLAKESAESRLAEAEKALEELRAKK